MTTTDPARHDRYRHLRANLDRHRDAMSFRTVKQWCVVCQLFEPDASGRCPLCQPSADGDLVADLLADRGGRVGPEPVTDPRLDGAGTLAPRDDREDGAA